MTPLKLLDYYCNIITNKITMIILFIIITNIEGFERGGGRL